MKQHHSADVCALTTMLALAGCASFGRPAGPPVTAFDGSYTGGGTLLQDVSDACPDLPPVTFNVQGGLVTYYGYRGWVRPTGSVTMQGGDSYVVGKFSKGGFVGHTYSPGGPCTYHLVLPKVS